MGNEKWKQIPEASMVMSDAQLGASWRNQNHLWVWVMNINNSYRYLSRDFCLIAGD